MQNGQRAEAKFFIYFDLLYYLYRYFKITQTHELIHNNFAKLEVKNMVETILFDFDGVVIDSEPLHVKTKAMALDAFGITYPPDLFDRFKGVPEKPFHLYVSENLDPQHRPYEIFLKKRHECLAEFLPEIKLVEGFPDFITNIKNRGIRTALVTSSKTFELDNIDKYLNVIHLFDTVVSAEATEQHKPHPAPYLKALELMKVSAENVIVIEDSPNGIISGRKAGCKVFALTTTFSEDELLVAGSSKIFESYSQMKNEL